MSAATVEVAGVTLTHPQKPLFAEQGLTKEDLALYLERIAPRMLPHVANRPLSLVRCPEGQGKACFFQRHAFAGSPAGIHSFRYKESKAEEDYIFIRDVQGLISLAQMGTLEIHIWGTHVDSTEQPDRMVFDLDPAPDVPFKTVRNAALQLRDLLEALDLASFPMLTGGKGIHVVVPLKADRAWETIKAFAGALARRLAEEQPDRFVATMSKAKRKGRIFIDYFRNDATASAIAPYSTRARAGAPLAWPVTWSALPRVEAANEITLANYRRRKGDPWGDYGSVRQSLSKAALRTLGIDS